LKLDGTFDLQVNATGVDQTLDGTPIPAGGRILVDGELIFDNGFSLEGAFGLTITGGAQPTLLVTATDAVLDLRGWASLTANGFLQIDSTGIAAQLTLTTATGTGDVSFGDDVSLSASLFLQVNTTGDTVEINPPAGGAMTVPGGSSYARVRADGNLVFFDDFDLDGTFDLTVSGSGLHVAADAELDVLDFKFTTNSELTIVDEGVYGNLLLTLGVGETFGSGLGFELDGTFDLQVNTTLSERGGIAPGARIHFDGILQLMDQLQVSGSFDLALEDDLLLMTVQDATFQLAIGQGSPPHIFASYQVSDAALGISEAGVAGVLDLTPVGTSNFSGFDLSGMFLLQVNTTGEPVPTIGDVNVNLPAGDGPYARVRVTGTDPIDDPVAQLTILGSTIVQGTFDLSVQAGADAALAMTVQNATFQLAIGQESPRHIFASYQVGDAALRISEAGVAGILDLTPVGTSNFSGFDLSGTFLLQVNTTGLAVPTIGDVTSICQRATAPMRSCESRVPAQEHGSRSWTKCCWTGRLT
jgi:hypothetical protein